MATCTYARIKSVSALITVTECCRWQCLVHQGQGSLHSCAHVVVAAGVDAMRENKFEQKCCACIQDLSARWNHCWTDEWRAAEWYFCGRLFVIPWSGPLIAYACVANKKKKIRSTVAHVSNRWIILWSVWLALGYIWIRKFCEQLVHNRCYNYVYLCQHALPPEYWEQWILFVFLAFRFYPCPSLTCLASGPPLILFFLTYDHLPWFGATAYVPFSNLESVHNMERHFN